MANIAEFKIKEKKCVICKKKFKPFSTLSRTCTVECGLAHALRNREKKERSEKKAGLEGLKTKAQRLDLAEIAFRRFIRARDRLFFIKQGRPPECVSCGTTNPNIQYAAGHLKTKGAHSELRFDENNCHLQCNKYCNESLSGNINGTKTTRGYLAGLREIYGSERADEIINYVESHHPLPNWSNDDIEAMKKDFNKRARELEKAME